MKSRRSLLVTLGALTFLAAGVGCSNPTDDDDLDAADQEVGSAVVSTRPSARALASTHARVTLTGARTMTAFIYAEELAPVRANVPGVEDGSVVVDQVIDVENPGDAHRFGVYTTSGRKVGEVDVLARQSSSFQIRRRGDYHLTCEDCVDLSAEAKAAKDWPAFVAIANGGRAFAPARPGVPVRVVSPPRPSSPDAP